MFIFTDKPSENVIDEDLQSEANSLADIIINSEAPFAIGIYGGWGSGKSTLMTVIKKKLDETDNILTCDFNAWLYHRSSNQLEPLLRELKLSLNNEKTGFYKKYKEDLVKNLAKKAPNRL